MNIKNHVIRTRKCEISIHKDYVKFLSEIMLWNFYGKIYLKIIGIQITLK
jgi:hypothetical protein